MSKKYFIITVDTEGDNLWDYKKGDQITTHNTKYIPRFQELCEKYGFKPVYLTNYEMLCDDAFVEYAIAKEQQGLCEIGLHLHAWNNPPLYELDAKYTGNPYLIEYPDDIMRAKFEYLYNLFCEKIGHKPYSHRAGRWAMDERYFRLLEEFDIKVDCSVTPRLDWSNVNGELGGGPDYRTSPSIPHWIGSVLEMPLTVKPSRALLGNSLKQNIKTLLRGRNLQFRPAGYSLKEMKYVVDKYNSDKSVDYLEFMLHSSELMPGGSPYFIDDNAINTLYWSIQSLFEYAKQNGYKGITLLDYYSCYNEHC